MPGGVARLVIAPYGEGKLGVTLGAGAALTPMDGAPDAGELGMAGAPGAGEFGVEAGAGGGIVPVDGALVGGELGVAVGAVVPVAGVPGAGDLTSGGGYRWCRGVRDARAPAACDLTVTRWRARCRCSNFTAVTQVPLQCSKSYSGVFCTLYLGRLSIMTSHPATVSRLRATLHSIEQHCAKL